MPGNPGHVLSVCVPWSKYEVTTKPIKEDRAMTKLVLVSSRLEVKYDIIFPESDVHLTVLECRHQLTQWVVRPDQAARTGWHHSFQWYQHSPLDMSSPSTSSTSDMSSWEGTTSGQWQSYVIYIVNWLCTLYCKSFIIYKPSRTKS